MASSVLYFNALVLHAPISTTHTITSAVMGVGATKRLSAVRWGVARGLNARGLTGVKLVTSDDHLLHHLRDGFKTIFGYNNRRGIKIH